MLIRFVTIIILAVVWTLVMYRSTGRVPVRSGAAILFSLATWSVVWLILDSLASGGPSWVALLGGLLAGALWSATIAGVGLILTATGRK